MKKTISIILILAVSIPCLARKPSWYMPEVRKVSYKGGDGSSYENAVKIKRAETMEIGIMASYLYIEKKQGKMFKIWRPLCNNLEKIDNKYYSTITIQNISKSETKQKYVFDVTDFYGKYY